MLDKRRYRIVVGIDASEVSEVVLETALDVAARHHAADVHVVSVLAPQREREHAMEAQLAELEGSLRALVADKLAVFALPAERLRVHVHTRVGEPAEQIAFLAWEAEADVIIVGRHGDDAGRLRRGWRRFVVGTVPDRVLRLARCPVLVVQATSYEARAEDSDELAGACAECAAVRRDSDGTRWFCAEHSDYRLSRATVMAHPYPGRPLGGGPLL